jgi:FkbM family methyltransferase
MTAEKDVDILVHDRFFKDKSEPGVFVEVGAALPDYLSISARFRDLGWKIVAIEPNPEFCQAHRSRGHQIYEYACSDVDADDMDFFVVDSQGADYLGGSVSFESFSSLGIKDEFAELHETVKNNTRVKTVPVKVRRLDTILKEHEPEIDHIDILAIDVEGWELNVLRGLSLEKYNPSVVILENLFNKEEYVEFMKKAGYAMWSRLEPNDVYVAKSFANIEEPKKPLWSRLLGFMAKLKK